MKTLATPFPLDEFDPGAGYPAITWQGTTIADDAEAATIESIAAAQGITLRELTNPPAPPAPIPNGAVPTWNSATGRYEPSAGAPVLKTTADATYAVKPYIPAPQMIGHMGGDNVYPEHSVEGHTACAQQGFGVDLDVHAGSGGVPLVIHDTTYTRTMVNVYNAAGTALVNVSDATEDQHVRGMVKPAAPSSDGATASRYGTVRSLDWYLDTFGGQTFLTIETKDDTADLAQRVIDKVTARGLHKAVLLSSAYYDQVLQFRAAGLRACYIADTAVPATVAADGVEMVCLTLGAITSATVVTNFHSVGVKVATYAVQTKYDYDRLIGYGVDNFWADSPWMATRRYPAVARYRWDDGYGRPNRGYYRQSTTASELVFKVRQEVPCIELQDASNLATGGKVGAYPLSELGMANPTGKYRFKVTFLPPLAGQTGDISDRWFMLHIGHGPTNDNGPFANGLGSNDASRRGYSFRILRSGAMFINFWNFGSGADIANNTGAMPASAFAAPGAGSVELEFEVTITATTLVLKCLTAGYTTSTTTVTNTG